MSADACLAIGGMAKKSSTVEICQFYLALHGQNLIQVSMLI